MKECPRCHKMTLEDEEVLNSLSQRDSKTYICKDCGNDEALVDQGVVLQEKLERDFVAKVRK